VTEELKEEAKVLLKRVREALAGLLLEMREGKKANRRAQDASDFMIAELRDLVRAVRALLKKMEDSK